MIHFPNPDWYQVMTIDESKKEFSDLRFQGVGWYSSKGDYMLVIVDPNNPEKHRFYIYNGRNPIEQFKAIYNLPVFVDKE